MTEKAWRFQLDVIGYGDDPDEAWSNLLLYALTEPPCERVPEQDMDPEDDEEEQGAKKVDVAIYLFMEASSRPLHEEQVMGQGLHSRPSCQ